MDDALPGPSTSRPASPSSRPVTPSPEAYSRRHNSLYDLTSLRLHADGLRALPGDRIWRGRSFHSAAPVKDKWGNVFASDAGGRSKLLRVRPLSRSRSGSRERRRRRLNDASGSEYEDFSFDDEDEDGMDVDGLKDPKARIRRAFYEDFSFLDEPQTVDDKDRAEMKRLYHPSSDLLKYIHHYASEVYDASGELRDATAGEVRPDRPRKTAVASSSVPSAAQSPSSSSSGSSSSSSNEEEEQEEERDKDEEAGHVDVERLAKLQKWKKRTGQKKGRPVTTGASARAREKAKRVRRKPKATRNMFRALDASALFCIGLLVQEQVAKMIDQPLSLSLGPELDALDDNEMQRRYAQESQLLEQEDEDDIEREVRRHMAYS